MRGVAFAGLVLACGLGACADDVTLAPAAPAERITSHVSGSRLRSVVTDTGSLRIHTEWLDTKLGVRCTFLRAEDGTLRCLPNAGAPLAGDGPLFYTLALRDDACGTAPHAAYRTKGPVTTHPSCRGRLAVPPSDTSDGDLHFPPSAFVKAVATIEPRDGRLAARVLVADDGAREVDAIVDTQTGEPCDAYGYELLETRDGARFACAPRTYAVRSATRTFRAGTSCDDGEEVVATFCPAPAIVVDYGACYGASTILYAAGPAVRGPVVVAAGNECRTATDVRGFVTMGGRLNETFPTMAIGLVGEGPVRAWAWTSNDGALLRTVGTLEDATTGRACVPTRIGGQLRCVPRDVARNAAQYADASCTVGVVATSGPTVCAPSPSPPSLVLVATSDCDAELRAVGGPHAGPLYVADAAGRCVHQDAAPDLLYYRIGDRVDPTRYPLVTDRVE